MEWQRGTKMADVFDGVSPEVCLGQEHAPAFAHERVQLLGQGRLGTGVSARGGRPG